MKIHYSDLKVGDIVYFENLKYEKIEAKVVEIFKRNKLKIEYKAKDGSFGQKSIHISYLFYKNNEGKYKRFGW